MGVYRQSMRRNQTICAASLADKVPERIECRINVIRRMIGADLEADFFIALRHHGVVQTGSEDVVTAQMSHQRRGACSVAQQQRHDRVLARSEEHTSELQSLRHLVCRLLLEKKNKTHTN